MNTEQLIHDLKQLGRYSDLEPNYWLLAVEKIEELSGKQIPKKPTPHIVEPVESPIKIGNMNWGRGTTIYYCPNCKDFISRTYTYCHKCGQALDWSDTE